MKQRCEGCKFFDCGEQCNCKCHHGVTDKIRQDHGAEDLKPKIENESKETAVGSVSQEGLSALFG